MGFGPEESPGSGRLQAEVSRRLLERVLNVISHRGNANDSLCEMSPRATRRTPIQAPQYHVRTWRSQNAASVAVSYKVRRAFTVLRICT